MPGKVWEWLVNTSPSMRREWIEIQVAQISILCPKSPSMRREWIEIDTMRLSLYPQRVSLHAEGVD